MSKGGQQDEDTEAQILLILFLRANSRSASRFIAETYEA